MKPNKVETEFISSELREEMVCRLCVHYCKAIDIEKNPEDLMFLDTLFEIEQQIFKECTSLEQYNSKFTELHNKKESFLASYLQNNNEKAEVVANFFEFSQPKNLTCRHNNEAENSTNDDIEQTEVKSILSLDSPGKFTIFSFSKPMLMAISVYSLEIPSITVS